MGLRGRELWHPTDYYHDHHRHVYDDYSYYQACYGKSGKKRGKSYYSPSYYY